MNPVDKPAVRRSFDAAARYYDMHASLQRAIVSRLMAVYTARLPHHPARILDAGSGSGFSTLPLKRAFRDSHIVCLDFSEGMLSIAREKLPRQQQVCGDVEALPFASSTFDLVCSSSVLQWCVDLATALKEFSRVMTGASTLLVAIYTAGTLRELRNSWAAVDAFCHTLGFLTVDQLRCSFESAGMVIDQYQTQNEVVLYDSVGSLLAALKQTGVRNLRRDRHAGLTAPSRLRKMKANYRARYATAGKIPASYIITFVRARRAC